MLSTTKKKILPLTIIFSSIFILLSVIRLKVPNQMILIDRFIPGLGILEIILLSLYGIWIGNKMLDPAKTAYIRSRIWAFFSVIFFLQLILGLAGIKKMLMTGALHLPVPALIIAGPIYRGGGLFMIILFLSTVLLVGPAWCSYLCYIGAWDDRMSRLHKGKQETLPKGIHFFRIIILILCIILPFILRFYHVNWLIGVILASVFGIIGVLIMVFLSQKKGIMVHCVAYCPLGLGANVIGKISPWRIKIHKNCSKCGKCQHRCRYHALEQKNLAAGKPGLTCTLCGDCLTQCKDHYLSYTFPFLSAELARVTFIVIIVITHTLFLAVARM